MAHFLFQQKERLIFKVAVSNMKEIFEFTVLKDSEPEYITITAYSYEQAVFLLELSGYYESDVIEFNHMTRQEDFL